MPRQKHDWELLKAEYLLGDVKDAAAWIRPRLGLPEGKPLSKSVAVATKGWAIDWMKYRRAIAIEALKASKKSRAKRMAEALDNIRDFFEAVAMGSLDPDTRALKVDEAEKVWKILRVENNMPSVISKNVVVVPEDPEDALNALQDESDVEVQGSQEVQDHSSLSGEEVVL